MTSIDLNADLGEGMPGDDELLGIVSSASIAAGGHAGDQETIRRTLLMCRQRSVRVGIHPGYADRKNFGRNRLDLPLDIVLGQVREQVIAVLTLAEETGVRAEYLKLHGALANQAAEELPLALALFRAVKDIDPTLAVLALDSSAQVEAAQALRLPVIREAYADRGYTTDGMLAPRSLPGAVIHDVDAVVERCLRLARSGEIVALDGTIIRSSARSICLHGDTPGAVEMTRAVRSALVAEGIAIGA